MTTLTTVARRNAYTIQHAPTRTTLIPPPPTFVSFVLLGIMADKQLSEAPREKLDGAYPRDDLCGLRVYQGADKIRSNSAHQVRRYGTWPMRLREAGSEALAMANTGS